MYQQRKKRQTNIRSALALAGLGTVFGCASHGTPSAVKQDYSFMSDERKARLLANYILDEKRCTGKYISLESSREHHTYKKLVLENVSPHNSCEVHVEAILPHKGCPHDGCNYKSVSFLRLRIFIDTDSLEKKQVFIDTEVDGMCDGGVIGELEFYSKYSKYPMNVEHRPRFQKLYGDALEKILFLYNR